MNVRLEDIDLSSIDLSSIKELLHTIETDYESAKPANNAASASTSSNWELEQLNNTTAKVRAALMSARDGAIAGMPNTGRAPELLISDVVNVEIKNQLEAAARTKQMLVELNKAEEKRQAELRKVEDVRRQAEAELAYEKKMKEFTKGLEHFLQGGDWLVSSLFEVADVPEGEQLTAPLPHLAQKRGLNRADFALAA